MQRSGADALPALDKILDVNRFIRMMALETILVHWDGYSMNRNNYRIYHDMDQDRLMFMPHGMDQMFGMRRASPEMSITPDIRGDLSYSIRGTPEGSLRYLEAVHDLTARYFNVPKLTNRVNELSACVRAAIAEHSPREAEYYSRVVDDLRDRISQRGASLKQQLAPWDRLVKFDADGVAKLSNWKSKVERGTPTFSQMSDKDEVETLQITANGAATFRARVALLPGRYRFEGDIKLENLVTEDTDVRGGACLRIGDYQSNNATRWRDSTDGFKHYVHRFQIQDELVDMDLLCDVRAKSGRVIFDARSLKLIQERPVVGK